MGAMIYAIFVCNALAGTCQAVNIGLVFSDPRTCIETMVKELGPGKLKDGRLYITKNEWFECDGKQTWSPVQ